MKQQSVIHEEEEEEKENNSPGLVPKNRTEKPRRSLSMTSIRQDMIVPSKLNQIENKRASRLSKIHINNRLRRVSQVSDNSDGGTGGMINFITN